MSYLFGTQQKKAVGGAGRRPDRLGETLQKELDHVSFLWDHLRSLQAATSLNPIFQTVSIIAVAKHSCTFANLRAYQSPHPTPFWGVFLKNTSLLLPSGPLLVVPHIIQISYCPTISFSSQLRCPFLREAFHQSPHPESEAPAAPT